MSDLAQRILTKLARASSKRPARAADVAALVGGPEPDFWRALEQLVVHRQVATAHIQKPARDPEPWLAIWPTGLHAHAGGWTGNSHSCLFVPTAPTAEAEHSAHAPKVRAAPSAAPSVAAPARINTPPAPEPTPTPKRPMGTLQQQIIAAVAGRARADALRMVALATLLGCSQQTIACTVRRLTSQGRIGRVSVESGPRAYVALYDLATEAQREEVAA